MKKGQLKAEDVIKDINDKLQKKNIRVSYQMTGFYFENLYTIFANDKRVAKNLTYRNAVKELSVISNFLDVIEL